MIFSQVQLTRLRCRPSAVGSAAALHMFKDVAQATETTDVESMHAAWSLRAASRLSHIGRQ